MTRTLFSFTAVLCTAFSIAVRGVEAKAFDLPDHEAAIPLAAEYIPLKVLERRALAKGRQGSVRSLAAQSFHLDEQLAMRGEWCSGHEPVAEYVMGLRNEAEAFRATPRRSDTVETFVARIVDPSPSFTLPNMKGAVGIIEFIEVSCAGIASPLAKNKLSPVTASVYGSHTIMLHGTVQQVRACLQATHLHEFILRMCHWNEDVVVHPAIQRAVLAAKEGGDSQHTAHSRMESQQDSLSPVTFNHVVAVLTPSASASRDRVLISELSTIYNSKERIEDKTGFSFAVHSLSDETIDDGVRHFVCNPRKVSTQDTLNEQHRGDNASFVMDTSHCRVESLVEFILETVAHEENGVLLIEPRNTIRVANKFSRGLLESGKQFEEPFGKGLGLTGEGFVVAVADTGVDYDHCFFKDPNRDVPLNRLDTQHRKIIRYMTVGSNQGDFNPGHGTHVAGSIAGSNFNPTGDYADFHGVLPAAKLVVWDQSVGSGEGLRGVSNFHDLFGISYKDGAHVHSNSWGSSSASYTSEASTVDSFTNMNPYLLPVFAAGNDADRKCGTSEFDLYCDRRTVISPCVAKNVLCVGASMGSYDSWKFAKLGNYIVTVPGFSNETIRVLKGNFGPTDVDLLTDVELVIGDPYNACTALNGNVTGKIVVVERGTCTFIAKIKEAQKNGALGMLIINNVNGDAIIMGCDEVGDCGIRIANFMVEKVIGNKLKEYLVASSGTPGASKSTFRETQEQDPHKGEDNLSEFSSHGPTSDNRYKPEVVAVGELVISAFSDANLNSNNCDVWPTQGTSMATPLASGLIVMLQQYFTLGIHIDGSLNNKDKGFSNMTSSFLKAAIIHAAAPLTGVFDRNSRGDWRQLGRAPTSEQGHGKPRLNYSFPTSSSSPVRVFIDDSSSVGNGRVKDYCVAYNGRADSFTATLTWIDPANRGGSAFALVNNLNLIVITPDGSREFHGNMDPTSNTSDVRAFGTTEAFDVLNNAEKVRIPRAPEGVYRVRVEGASVSSAAQKYSLIVSGTAATPCGSFCEQFSCVNGKCTPEGVCVCAFGWGGPRCDTPSYTAPQSLRTAATIALEPMQWIYLTVPASPLASPSESFAIQSLVRDGEIDYALCETRATSGINGGLRCVQKDTACQTCGARGPPEVPQPLALSHSPTVKRVLGITAQCCYQSVLRLSATTPRADAVEVVEVASATFAELSSDFYLFSVTLTIEGLSTLAAELLGNMRVIFRSSQWSADGSIPRYHGCAVVAVNASASTLVCQTQTLPCVSSAAGEYFSITFGLVKDGVTTIISSPHPSAVHLQCRQFKPTAAVPTTTKVPSGAGGGGDEDTAVSGSSYSKGVAYHTVQPDGSLNLPFIDGVKCPDGQVSRKIVVLESEFKGQTFEIVGTDIYGFSKIRQFSLKLAVQTISTDTVDDTKLRVGKATLFDIIPAVSSRGEGSLHFTMPPEISDTVRGCGAASDENCGLVRIQMNLVVSSPGSDSVENGQVTSQGVIFVVELNIFVTSQPRVTGVGMLKKQSDDPEGLILEEELTLSAAEVAQYSDTNFIDSNSLYKAERWMYFKGRFLSDPRTSLAFGGLLEGASLVSPSDSSLFLRIRVPSLWQDEKGEVRYSYCGLVKALSDELLECLIMLSTIERGPSDVSTLMPVEARFPGYSSAVEQKQVKVSLGPSGMVTGLRDTIGSIVNEYKVSAFQTIAIVGKNLPYQHSYLFVVTATPTDSESALVYLLSVLSAAPDALIVRFGEVGIKAGRYALHVALTTHIPIIPQTPIYFTYKGHEATSYITGISLGVRTDADDNEDGVADLRVPSGSTNANPVAVTLHGVRLRALMAESPFVRLSTTLDKEDGIVRTESCIVDLKLSTDYGVVCYLSPFADGRYALDLMVGAIPVPAPVMESGQAFPKFTGSLFVTIKPPKPLPAYVTAFSFDTVLLVGASTTIKSSSALAAEWATDREHIEMIISATPCTNPTSISTSALTQGDDGSITGFVVTPTTRSESIVHMCLKNGVSQTESGTRLHFYTTVSLEVVVLSVSDITVAKSDLTSPGGFVFDISVQLQSSLEGDFVNTIYVYADVAFGGEASCGTSASSWNSHAAAHWRVPVTESPFVEAHIRNVLVSADKAQTEKIPLLCIAVSTRVNEVDLPSERFVPTHTVFDCLPPEVGVEEDFVGDCGGYGVCVEGATCNCPSSFAGDKCTAMCEAGFDGRTCSGFRCGPNDMCDCADGTVVDLRGNTFVARGPACHVPTRRVLLDPVADPIFGTTEDADAVRVPIPHPFKSAPIYFPPSVPSSQSDEFSRSMPIVLEMGGEGMEAFRRMPKAARSAVRLDVIVIAPSDSNRISLRLHQNDSRLLQPIGASHIYISDSNGILAEDPTASPEFKRRTITVSLPLTGKGCAMDVAKKNDDEALGPTAGFGCFIVVEVARSSNAIDGAFSHAAIGARLRYEASPFSSIDRLVAMGLMGSDMPRPITMTRLDTSSFTTVFALLGMVLSLLTGSSCAFVWMGRKKMLTLQGPALMLKSLLDACLSKKTFSRRPHDEDVEMSG